MKWLVYNLLFAVAYVALLPSFLLRMKRRGGYRARMGDRFGRYPPSLAFPPSPIWIHAVSVGEVAVAGQLMRALRARDASIRFVFSTTSSTGWKQAQKELAEGDVLIYNPLDFGGCVRRALDRVSPRAIVLVETELWPTFIRAARRRGVPLYLVNARVSDRSAPRYRLARWWFGEVLRAFTTIFAQSDLDARRLIAAGAAPAAVHVTGSFKFDVAHRNPAKERELADWIRQGESGNDGELLPGFVMPEADASATLPPILLGGSTWPGEDEVLLRIYRQLLHVRPDVRLVLVPRHFEKADAVEINIRRAGFPCIRRSRSGRLPALPGSPPSPIVYLGDTTGEMMGFFGLATVAFVGKSLCAHGSQNMIEPCLCGVPTIVGPYTENFRSVMSDLLAAEAIVQVQDEESVRREVLRLFLKDAERAALGARAHTAVQRRCGVVDRCAEELVNALKGLKGFKGLKEGEGEKGLNGVKGFKGLKVFLVLAVIYALAGWFCTPPLRQAWNRLPKNPTRRYSTFLGLSAASVAMPWCLGDLRTAYIRLATRDYGFSGGKPSKVEKVNGHVWATYDDEDYGGPVVTRDGWPVVTGEKFKATRLLAELIPFAEGMACPAFSNASAVAVGDVASSNAVRRLPARRIDGRLLSLARLKGILDECRQAFGDYKFWCIGQYDYLVTPSCEVAADRLMALFDDPAHFVRFADAGIYSAADLYACYVGADFEIEPALANVSAYGALRSALTAPRLAFAPLPDGNLTPVRPALVTPMDAHPVDGLVPGAADSALFVSLTNRIAIVQAARREAIRGLDAAASGISTNALEHWTRAAQDNPRDPILKNIADALDLEGRRRLRMGDANGALRCYENRIVVSPHDVAAIHNFGVCLKKAGQPEMAARVFLKAVTMDPRTDEHRLEFVGCAAASGHLDAASRQMEVLMARHPNDPHLKLRAARLLVLPKNSLRDETRAVKLAEEAATQTKWRNRTIVQGLADVYIEAGRVLMGMGLKKKMKEMTFDE